jgi:hypothetical protein
MGCEVVYPPDHYPIGRPLPEARLDGLCPPEDLWSAFPYREIARQVAYLNRRLEAAASPSIPVRGVLNEAVILRGDAFLLELAAAPERARRLLAFSADLIRRQLEANRVGCMITNCTVPLVGPRTYESEVLPFDRQVADLCRRQQGDFAIHHCGAFDSYVPLYRQLSPVVAALDIGHESDLRLAMERFPESAHVSQIVEARLMNAGSPAEVGGRIDRLLDASRGHWHRLWLNVADIEFGAPDDNLNAVYEHLRRAR